MKQYKGKVKYNGNHYHSGQVVKGSKFDWTGDGMWLYDDEEVYHNGLGDFTRNEWVEIEPDSLEEIEIIDRDNRMKAIKYIVKILVMLVFTLSILVFHAFGLRLVIEFADELGYTDLQITIFEISFLGIYFLIGWLLIITLGYILFRKERK